MIEGGGWRPTAALSRALIIGLAGLGLGIAYGQPAALVLAAAYVVHAALALVAKPSSKPVITSHVEHDTLHEGQGTRVHVNVEGADGVEQVTRVAHRREHLLIHPSVGRVSGLLADGVPVLEVSPRRWGRRTIGLERVALTSPWAGYRWGPISVPGQQLQVLPQAVAYESNAEAPQPHGLVGAHRSMRFGSGTEFADIREFHPGDRLRRINWRVSTRTEKLHSTISQTEEDGAMLIVLDALSDHGVSEGVDGDASSLDLSVRAGAAVAENAVRRGDRVGLRVIGARSQTVPVSAGWRHLRRMLGTIATIAPGPSDQRLRLAATEGTTVIVLSPMLDEFIGTFIASAVRRGLPTLVIDTFPPGAKPVLPDGANPRLGELALRMRLLEREQVLAALQKLGCPVVPWRGAGTIDDVLRQLSRRSRLPRPVAR